jgi:hypothetical protein
MFKLHSATLLSEGYQSCDELAVILPRRTLNCCTHRMARVVMWTLPFFGCLACKAQCTSTRTHAAFQTFAAISMRRTGCCALFAICAYASRLIWALTIPVGAGPAGVQLLLCQVAKEW